MLSDYQLKTADLCNIPVDNVKKLVSKVRDYYENLQLYLKLGLMLKKYIVY